MEVVKGYKGYIQILWVILFCAVYDISVGALRELMNGLV